MPAGPERFRVAGRFVRVGTRWRPGCGAWRGTPSVRFLRAMALANARKWLTGRGVVMVTLAFADWNQIDDLLRRLEVINTRWIVRTSVPPVELAE